MNLILKMFLLWLCFISIAFAQKQIDTFNILLPQIYQDNNGKPIQLVTTQGGCFEWASSSPEAVSVKSLSSDNEDCYLRGLVQLRHIGSYPGSIYITATNSQTQELSNIPVRIKPIAKIQIIAKSRMMNRNQLQDLSVFAYDKQHNMFTSLQGLKFEWRLVQNQEVLSKVSLKNSHLILPLEQRKNIQKKGAQSDILVIRGQNPGKAIVRVRCIQPGYQSLSHEITVSVHQRFDIHPSVPTYLLVQSTYEFGLMTPSRQPIQIPRPYYRTVLSSSLFKASQALEVRAPLSQGQTLLKVEDVRTSPPYSSQVMVYAKQPDQILLKVDQYIIVGEQAPVAIQLYWRKNLLKGKSDKYKITTQLPYDTTKRTILARQRTTATVKAVYGALMTEKKVYIVLPLKAVLPANRIVLPLDETFQLKTLGGSGLYEYHIQGDIATISGSGVIVSKKQGQTTVTVTDKRVPKNTIIIDLVVSPLSSLTPLQNHKELNVNEFGPIFTLGKTKNYQQFTKCQEQPITLEISHLPSFQVNSNTTFSRQLKSLNAKMSASSVVKTNLMKTALLPMGIQEFVYKFATYTRAGDATIQQIRKYAEQLQNYGICSLHSLKSYDKFDSQMDVYTKLNNNVRNKFNLRVYQKLSNMIQDQTDNYFIMTPLACLSWKTSGGSYKWETNTKTLFNSVQYHTAYPTVKCPEKQTVLKMKIQKSNVQTTQLLLPVSQSMTIYVQCRYPSSLKIKFQKQNQEANLVNGLRGHLIKGQLIPLDSKGQTFYNSSNLVYEFDRTAGAVKILNDRFQFDPQSSSTAKVTFWTDRIQELRECFSKVSTFFSYLAKDMFEIYPHPEKDYLVTLYNPKITYLFGLNKISETTEIQCQGSVSCTYQASSKQIKLNTTRLGEGSMRIRDRSLYDYPSLNVEILVVDTDQIVLQTSKTSVQAHKKISAQIRLFYQKRLIPTWQYDLGNLMLVHEAGIRSNQMVSSNRSNLYQINAQKPGLYHITAQLHYPRYLQSPSVVLTVYPRIQTNIPNLEQSYDQNDVLYMKGELMVAINCLRKIYISGGPEAISVTHKIIDENTIQVRHVGKDYRQIQIVGIDDGKTKVILTVTSATQKNQKIAIIEIQVNAKSIDHATIYSIDEAVVNAQFRLIPHLIIDGRVLLDSVCDLEYKWKNDQLIKLKGFNNKRLGINATAAKEGNSYVNLQVSSKDGSILFTSTKQITIHKIITLQMPTVIGQHYEFQPSSLLLPPNSGYNFDDSSIYITKISQCQDSLLSVSQNKLTTSREKGMVSVKLQKTNDDSYNSYLNVIVTEIRALFIQNSYSHVISQLGKVKQLRFYVQDMYGRLFHNTLFNIDYDVISSNQEVFVASIDSTKKYINIHPKKQGQATLILKLKSSESSSNIGKLLQIPHDIVTVQVGKVIQPQSPIYMAAGGSVNIQYHGDSNEKWQILSGKQIIQIYPSQEKIVATKPGEAIVSIGGYTATVRVLDVTIKQKVIQKPKPGSARFVAEYIASGKWMDQQIIFSSIQNTFNYINNNLNLTCAVDPRGFFITRSYIVKTEYFDKLVCETTMDFNIDVNLELPQQVTVKVLKVGKNGAKSIVYTSVAQIQSTFWVPQKYRTVLLSTQQPKADVFVKSTHALETQVIGGQQSWIHERFDSSLQAYGIRLTVDSKSYKKNFDFTLRVSSPQTGQTEQILVKFIIDESARRAQAQKESARAETAKQAQNREKQPTASQQQPKTSRQTASTSSSLFMGWHWTDFIILIMAINFILILIYQACINGGDKYKVL